MTSFSLFLLSQITHSPKCASFFSFFSTDMLCYLFLFLLQACHQSCLSSVSKILIFLFSLHAQCVLLNVPFAFIPLLDSFILLMWVFVFCFRYASIRAIESKSPIDDQQWLTYWVLYSLITLFELTFAKVIEW